MSDPHRVGAQISVWRVEDGSLVTSLHDHRGGLSVALRPDGRLLAAPRSWERKISKTATGRVATDEFVPESIKLWDTASGQAVKVLRASASIVGFSPDGRFLFGTAGQRIEMWRVSDGRLVRTLKATVDQIVAAAFSPDGTLLAAASVDFGSWLGRIVIWRLFDGGVVRTCELERPAFAVAFSGDGSLLASAGDDNNITLWSPRAGRKSVELLGVAARAL